MSNIEITSVQRLLDAIGSVKLLEQPHAHVRAWFRGHAQPDWELAPGVYRPGFAHTEEDRLQKERHLTQDFQALGYPSLSGPRSDVEIYFLQQHYGMPTRLLDWSLNPLTALFFAVSTAPDADGVFYVLDAYGFAEGRGLVTPRAEELRDAMRAIFEWKNAEALWPKRILAVRPFNIDPRIEAQRGCFTFHPRDHSAIPNASKGLMSFRVPAASKSALREQLGLLGVDEFTTYGGLDNLSKRLKYAHR